MKAPRFTHWLVRIIIRELWDLERLSVEQPTHPRWARLSPQLQRRVPGTRRRIARWLKASGGRLP